MGTYSTKNYNESGDVTVIEGEIKIASGGKITAAGTQAAHIANASVAHALNATFSNTEAEGALDAHGTKINAILVALEGAGILASS